MVLTANLNKTERSVVTDNILTQFHGIVAQDHEANFYHFGKEHATCGAYLSWELKGMLELQMLPWAGEVRQDDRAAFYPLDGADTADFADGGRGENRPHACGGTVLLEERRAGKPLCHDGERRSNALTLTGTADEKPKPERAA